MRSLFAAGISLLFLLAVVVGWWMFAKDRIAPRIYRYRLTVYADTPDGERVGSGVIQVKTRFPGGLMKARGYYTWVDVKGQAVIIDFGDRGKLFVLLSAGGRRYRYGDADGFVEAFFPRREFAGKTSSDAYASYLDELNLQKPKADIPLDELPQLVRFRDLKNPASVAEVEPNDLSTSFGPGFRLKRAVVEITDAPPTTGICVLLPWLPPGNDGGPLIPTAAPATIEDLKHVPSIRRLNYLDFRRHLP